MREAKQTDVLKNLVLFIVALAIVATILVLAWYFGVEMPAQKALLHAPENLCSGWYC
ncbi:hypothetical protein [Methanoregula sp.]|uniref:hypothetical protein n=1 Tax=Methanoregula sp. TaxID=2052170 RepID=UPI003564B3F6